MLGAIVGDVIGSRHEFNPIRTTDFELINESCIYTDDTVLTLAIAKELIRKGQDFASAMRSFGNEYVASYGLDFYAWLKDPKKEAYGSWANGSSMRVSPTAWLTSTLEQCDAMAEATSAVTHNHPEAIRAARAVAVTIFAFRSNLTVDDVREILKEVFGYDLSRSVDELRKTSDFQLKSWISVPEALTCALEATDFENAIRLAVSLGGDADTQAAIAGSVAEARFGIPQEILDDALSKLPQEMRDLIPHFMNSIRIMPFTPASKEDFFHLRKWDPSENIGFKRSNPLYMSNKDELEQLEMWISVQKKFYAEKKGLLARLVSWIKAKFAPRTSDAPESPGNPQDDSSKE